MTDTTNESLPIWSVSDVHESLESRTFVDSMERLSAEVGRLEHLFDDNDIRGRGDRDPLPADLAGQRAQEAIDGFNRVVADLEVLEAYVYATVATNTRDERAQSLLSEIEVLGSRVTPLLARLAEFAADQGVDALSTANEVCREHVGPLTRLAERAEHQMSEAEEGLFAELSTTGSSAWGRLHSDVTSQLSADVTLPDGTKRLPMPAVRGLATHSDPSVRRAAYDAEIATWPEVSTPCAAAMNSIKGEANSVNRRRRWRSPLDASMFANSVSPAVFDAMQTAIVSSLPDFRSWMRTKARLHGHVGPSGESKGLPWWDLVAPLPDSASEIDWTDSIDLVRRAFADFSPSLGRLVDRAIEESWLDAPPREGKVGGAFCMPFVGDRSLILLNWSGSLESTQTTAHELGHAYHNTQLATRTALQKRLPMALAETASIFCETLVVEAGLSRLEGRDRLALLDIDLVGSNQVVVDIHSRFLFETEVFARRQRRTLGAGELDEMMREAQAAAYGDGLDQTTAHPYMWIVKPHYYGSHFYNWPYTYGLLFGLGLFSCYRDDPDRFRAGYDTLLSRAGMDTAEELGAAFGLDVASVDFWNASIDVLRRRMQDYSSLAAESFG